MQPLKVNSSWRMKDVRVVVKSLTYPLLSEESPESTTISSDENISFDPATPCSMHTSQSHHKPVWHQLTFSTSDE